MRRVVLVDLYWTRDKDPRVPLGHASLLASLLRDPTIEVAAVVMAVNAEGTTPEAITARILRHTRDLRTDQVDIAIGAYVWAEHILQRVLPALRTAGFSGRIILGGPQISYAGPGVADLYPEADAFVRGYGEDALLALAKASGRPPVHGVVYRGEPDCADQARVALEELPSPWLTGTIPLLERKFVRWETQRGCPYRCSFCQHREPGARLRWRGLSEARVLAEVDALCNAAVADVAVLDPIFNVGRLAVPVLERFAQNGFGGRLSFQCRAECIDATFLSAAARLDARLEFGLQTVHSGESEAIERRNDIKKVDAALAEVRRLGIAHEVTLIFGLPLQTLDSFVESVAWCLERRVPVVRAFPLMLLRGTELDRARDRWGLVESDGPMPVVLRSTSFGVEEWRKMARISEALRATEGLHPRDVSELLSLARKCEPSWERWRPDAH